LRGFHAFPDGLPPIWLQYELDPTQSGPIRLNPTYGKVFYAKLKIGEIHTLIFQLLSLRVFFARHVK
jgi:hypothetical protein